MTDLELNKYFFLRFDFVSCGGTFTVAITKQGKVYSWGKTSRGQLGRSTSGAIAPEPKEVSLHESIRIVSLSASHGTTLLAVSGKKMKYIRDATGSFNKFSPLQVLTRVILMAIQNSAIAGTPIHGERKERKLHLLLPQDRLMN